MKKFKSMLSAFLATTTAASLLCNTAASSVSASQKGEEVAAYAEALVGISGRPNIITDYWRLVTEWCAMAVFYVGDKTGVPNSFPRSTYVDKSGIYKDPTLGPGFRDWFEERGRFYYQGELIPGAGDLIIFDYNGDGYGDHIGFVKSYNGATNIVYTIEGNVNDQMLPQYYYANDYRILGYCRPDYNDSNYSAPPVTTAPTPVVTTTAVSTFVPTSTTTTVAVNPVTPPSYNSSDYYVSSSIGCNLRSQPEFNDNNIMQILDTNTTLHLISTSGSFYYVRVGNTDTYGYVHYSTVSQRGQNTYSYGCKENYYVSSSYGCYLYSSPYNTDTSTAKILDYNQKLTLLSMGKEYSYVEVVMYNGNVYNGYVKNDVISPISQTSTNTATNSSGIVLSGTSYSSCGCIPYTNYKYVSSDIGCKFRSQPNMNDSNVMYILDTYTPVNIISAEQDFYYCSVYVNQNLVYGYIHSSVLS